MVSIMAERTPGVGEAAARTSRRRFWGILGGMFGVGLVMGAAGAALQLRDGGGLFEGTLPPWFALTSAIVTLVALTLGSWAFFRRIDELERQDNLVAAAAGANVLMFIYPVWFVLARGGLVREPHHLMLFGILFLTMTGTYLFRKFR